MASSRFGKAKTVTLSEHMNTAKQFKVDQANTWHRENGATELLALLGR